MAAKDKVPLGAALALLLASAGATAAGEQGDIKVLELGTAGGERVSISVDVVPTVDEFILMPAEGGDFAAQHQSHASHASHSSHSSHASHASHSSHASSTFM